MNSDALYVARGIGIILVVFGHLLLDRDRKFSLATGGDLLKVYAFHMPLFFFLAGMVLDYSRPFLRTTLRYSSVLLRYYVATVAILSTLTVLVFAPLGTGVKSSSPIDLGTYFVEPFTTRSTHVDLFIVGWFLIALALARPLAHFCLARSRHILLALPVAIGLAYFGIEIAGSMYDRKTTPALWYVNISSQIATGAAFCILGAVTQHYLLRVRISRPLLVAALAYAVHITIGNRPLSMAWSDYPGGGAYHTLSSLAAIFAVLGLASAWQNSVALKTIGQYSRAVMSYHGLAVSGLSTLAAIAGFVAMEKVAKFTALGPSSWAVYLAAGVGFPVLGALLIERLQPHRVRRHPLRQMPLAARALRR